MNTTLNHCRALDAGDILRALRGHFELPDGVIYLDGNSLGVLPKSAAARVADVVTREWGQDLIRSWNSAGWFHLPQRLGDKIAPLVGAAAGEVVVTDSTSVNLYKVLSAALSIAAEDAPGKKTVVSERSNFPTDLYIAEGLCRERGYQLLLVEPDGILPALNGDAAVLMLTHVNYRTGAMHDMLAVTAAAHAAGSLMVWDLAHSAGAVPVDLQGAKADFAVGCGYKYLNGGPGAPAFAFVAERHHEAFQQPLTGWMGHAAPFAFTDDYAPAPGVNRLLCGTPPIPGLAALEVGVDLIAEISVERLYAKSQQLSEFFRLCLSEQGVDLALASPPDPAQRGSQLSFRHPEAYAISQALIARGVIGDFRDPDILRLGFAPAYLRFEDMAEAAQHLAEVLASDEWQRAEYRNRATVT